MVDIKISRNSLNRVLKKFEEYEKTNIKANVGKIIFNESLN